jgi:regulatory protein
MRRKPHDDAQRPSAYAEALTLLTRREHSRRELKTRLRRKGHANDDADAAIGELAARQYQDDERFAAALIRRRASRGYGPLRLRAELKGHDLSEARIRALLDDAGCDWNAAAAAQLRRRFGAAGNAVDAAERARRAQFLLRRGFAAATVRQVTHADVDDADAGS